MNITGSVALVTGANRGIGRRFAEELQRRGAAKVYATARNPEQIDLPGVEALRLDITDPASVAAAAEAATDVTLLVNNAGISTYTNLLDTDVAALRREVDTHLYGTFEVTRAFAPTLGAHGGGAIVNMLSALSWFAYPGGAHTYSVAKAAEWAMTNGVRLELATQGTLVVGVHVGAVDTDMMAGYTGPMVTAADVVHATLDAVEAGRMEVLVDDDARRIKASLADDPAKLYDPMLATAR